MVLGEQMFTPRLTLVTTHLSDLALALYKISFSGPDKLATAASFFIFQTSEKIFQESSHAHITDFL